MSEDLYDYRTNPQRMVEALSEVSVILHDKEMTDLQKLHQIHDAVFGYERGYIETLHYQLKVKPKEVLYLLRRRNEI